MTDPQIRTYLHKITALVPALVMPIERFLLRWGSLHCSQALPKGYKRGRPKECFRNAHEVAYSRPELQYAEGLVLSPKVGIPLLHGWAVDVRGMLVVDTTLDDSEECEYFGVAFPARVYVEELVRLRHYGILDSPCGPNIELFDKWEKIRA